MRNSLHDRFRGNGRAHRLFVAISGIAIAAVALLWGWNTIAAGLFALPEARYVHALSFELALVALLLSGRSAVTASRLAAGSHGA